MTYRVGQVLYAILSKEARVYPLLVVEEIVKKTLEGQTTSYMVRGGTDPKATMLISAVDGEIFETADAARQTLIDRATRSVNKLVDSAVQKAREWYPVAGADPEDPLTNAKIKKVVATPFNDDNGSVIELPDGTKARVKGIKLPDVLS